MKDGCLSNFQRDNLFAKPLNEVKFKFKNQEPADDSFKKLSDVHFLRILYPSVLPAAHLNLMRQPLSVYICINNTFVSHNILNSFFIVKN
jgi:hypothetical protein